jgi:hypothetical protein
MVCYIDDIWLATDTFEENLEKLSKLLDRLIELNLHANLDKVHVPPAPRQLPRPHSRRGGHTAGLEQAGRHPQLQEAREHRRAHDLPGFR